MVLHACLCGSPVQPSQLPGPPHHFVQPGVLPARLQQHLAEPLQREGRCLVPIQQSVQARPQRVHRLKAGGRRPRRALYLRRTRTGGWAQRGSSA